MLTKRIQKAARQVYAELIGERPAELQMVDLPLERRFSFRKGTIEILSLTASEIRRTSPQVMRQFLPNREKFPLGILTDLSIWAAEQV